VREELCEARAGDRAVEPFHVLADAVVEAEALLLAQAQDAGGSEAFGMRGDAEAVARRQRHGARQIGEAEGLLVDQLAAMRDRGDAAGPLERAHLEFEPLRNVVERRREPAFHAIPPMRVQSRGRL
jgi:hypothetical protein